MQEFRDYVISEYKVQGAKAIKFSFAHSATLKKGKSSQAPLNYTRQKFQNSRNIMV